jgi:hypothetical protein
LIGEDIWFSTIWTTLEFHFVVMGARKQATCIISVMGKYFTKYIMRKGYQSWYLVRRKKNWKLGAIVFTHKLVSSEKKIYLEAWSDSFQSQALDSDVELGKLQPRCTNFSSKQFVNANFGMLGLVREPLNVVLSTKGGIRNEDNLHVGGISLDHKARSRLRDSDAIIIHTFVSQDLDEGVGVGCPKEGGMLGEDVMIVV